MVPYIIKKVANTKYLFTLGLVAARLSLKIPPKKVKKAHNIEKENQYSLVQRATLSKITISE